MPLESVSHIADLNASNPVGSTDKVQTLDDHIRNIKLALLTDFPNVTGVVTPTHTELNYVDGVTSAIQTQIDGKAASSHNHSAADLTSGTVPDARFPATLPAASGVNLTALNGTNIASGTVADARLSSNIPKKDAANLFTAQIAVDNVAVGQSLFGGLFGDPGDPVGAAAVEVGVSSGVATVLGYNRNAGAGVNILLAGSAIGLSADAGTTNHVAIASTGALTTPNALASEVGFKGAPQNVQTDNYTLVLADAGKSIVQTGSSKTITIPSNSGGVAFPIGTTILIVAGAATSVAITSDTLFLGGASGTTGTRSLAAGTIACLYKYGSTIWGIAGAGVS